VIVPVRDNPEGIAALLARLSAQTLPRERFEVVIGDDGSARPLALDEAARVVSGPRETSYAARNRAVAGARGTILAFCDSDCLPEPDWLERGLDALDGADAAAGEVVFAPPPQPTVWSLLTMDMYLDQEANVRRGQAVTCNLFVRRELFDRLGGFDPTLPSGGDYDFARRAVADGARLVYAAEARVSHPTIDTSGAFLRKLWNVNRAAALRRARTTPRVDLGACSMLVPVLGPALARASADRPLLRLNHHRVQIQGRAVTRGDDLRALAVLYGLLGFVAGAARLAGWRAGREGRR
jgi:GT2 family glycosyltransferase